MNEQKEVKEVVVSKEDRDLVFKGIRPEGMDYLVFKQVRKELKIASDRYKGGQFKHISVNLGSNMSEKINPLGTYYKDTNKRYEGIDRLWEKNMSTCQ